MDRDLLKAARQVLLWWDIKLANELSSNFDFPWAEDAEWDEFHALRTAIRRVEADDRALTQEHI